MIFIKGLKVNTAETPPTPPTEPRIARLGDRVIAVFLDGFALFPLFFLTVLVCAFVFEIPAVNGEYKLTGVPGIIALSLWAIFWLAYHTVMEANGGQTLGKMIIGIRVVRADNRRPIDLTKAVLRNFFRPIDAIFFYLVGFIVAIASQKTQRIGDQVAGTVVVEERETKKVQALILLAILIIGLILVNVIVHTVMDQ